MVAGKERHSSFQPLLPAPLREYIKALWGLMGYIIPPAWFSVGRKVYSLLEVAVFIVMDVS